MSILSRPPMTRAARVVALLATVACSATHGQQGTGVAEQSPQVSNCPPMPAPISVGAAIDVFIGGTGPNPVYRIPAITKAGTRVLAFAEGRAALGDIGTNDLVLATSEDDGATWSAPRTVLDLADRSINNPCVVTLHSGAHAGRIVVPLNQGPYSQWTVYECFSDDGGATWSTLTPIESLPDPCCQAGLVSVAVGVRPVLAFTGCDSTTARMNGTLWISLDVGASWPIKQPLVTGFFAYSAPVDLGDGRIGVLAETDDYRRIRFIPVMLVMPAR